MEKIITLNFDGYYTVDSLPQGRHECPGVYAVYRGNIVSPKELLYIGRSGDISNRPSPNHERYEDWRNSLQSGEDLYFSYADTDDEEQAEAAIIFKIKPKLNLKGTKTFNYDKTTIITSGENLFLQVPFTVLYTP